MAVASQNLIHVKSHVPSRDRGLSGASLLAILGLNVRRDLDIESADPKRF